VLLATIDTEANRAMRTAWGLFRDRRPDLYGAITSLDGSQR
jgi:N-carbamoylputrescine amidase